MSTLQKRYINIETSLILFFSYLFFSLYVNYPLYTTKNLFCCGLLRWRESDIVTNEVYDSVVTFFCGLLSDIALKSTRLQKEMKQKEASEHEEPRSRASRLLQLFDFETANPCV